MAKKKIDRIAVFGGGAHIIPSYRALLNNLSNSYELVVYSEFTISKKYDAQYLIRSYPHRHYKRWLLVLWILLRFALDHMRLRFDVVHSHSTYPSGKLAILIKRVFRIPVVVCLNAAEAIGIESIQFGDLLNPRRTKINRNVIEQADAVTALTEFQASYVRKEFLRMDVQIIARGISYNNVKTKENVHWPGREMTFLHVGYLHPIKDPITLINCFHLLTKSIPCRLIQVGQDYMNGEVQRHATTLGISHLIEFKGFVEHDSIYQYYEAADVLLHTSLFESQAIVVNEALAHGLLVFGTHVGLLADLAEKCCITVPTGEYQVLAKKVIKTLSDKDCCERLLEKSKEWIAQHDLAWTTNRYKDLYIDVIERSARSK
ncbi:MAG: glycosyltransferase family 4 protein [Cyclobacteriaceae bacterium]